MEIKNLKIPEDVHLLLKIESARQRLPLGETIRRLIPDDVKKLVKQF